MDDARVMAAFDLIGIEGERCRFADATVIRTASELSAQRRSLSDIVRILARARDLAPLGRHKIVLTPSGDAALKWENGLTTLEGQGFLPLDVQHAGVDELFEQAELYEAAGNGDEAAKLYEKCANADRTDPIALFNLGNIWLEQEKYEEASDAYRRARARDPEVGEARDNIALALEAVGRLAEASAELGRVLETEPAHSDAVFNLAQILMQTGNIARAKSLYEQYLALDPPADWAATARKAITYCTARLSG
jgi:tetratricopeptide (TPR) repeat protein